MNQLMNMTKKELLNYLEPFTDDMKIFVWDDRTEQIWDAKASYNICKKENYIDSDVLQDGEGYIVINSNSWCE